MNEDMDLLRRENKAMLEFLLVKNEKKLTYKQRAKINKKLAKCVEVLGFNPSLVINNTKVKT